MEIQVTVFYIWIVVALITALLLFVNYKLRKFDPLSEPKGIVLLVMMGVQTVEKMVREKTNENVAKTLAPYIATVAVYIFISNVAGLLSLESPTANFSVTLALASVTCILIEIYAIKYNGLKPYLKSLCEPMAPFLVMNLISKVSLLASLSLRLFGNIVAGSMLMSVFYQLLAIVSGVIPVIGQFNFVAVLVAPLLHFYFDVFSGAMQTYIFITLSISFIGKELPKN